MEVTDILKRPYRRVLIPDDDSGTFTAMIAEFPGCISEGDSPGEAYANLEDAAESWLEAAIENGIPIPAPESESEFSGRIVLRMPRTIHRRSVNAAESEGVSLNTFLVTAISERLGQISVRRELASLRKELLDAISAPIQFAGIVGRASTPPERFNPERVQVFEGAGTTWSGDDYRGLLSLTSYAHSPMEGLRFRALESLQAPHNRATQRSTE